MLKHGKKRGPSQNHYRRRHQADQADRILLLKLPWSISVSLQTFAKTRDRIPGLTARRTSSLQFSARTRRDKKLISISSNAAYHLQWKATVAEIK